MKDENIEISGLTAEELKQTLFRLSHFDPSRRDSYGNQFIDYVVLDALSSFGQLKITATEIKEYIESQFHLDFEEQEINACGQRLSKRNLILFSDHNGKNKATFQIESEIENKIKSNLAKIQEIEVLVLDDWKKRICQKYEDYTIIKDNIDGIVSNLQKFISKMFLRHGIECVSILYPEDEKAQKWLTNIQSSILDELPRIEPTTDAAIKLEIPLFFKELDDNKRTYITSLFNSSFFWHLSQVDENCSNLITQVTKGQRLYLDNNILYCLVGFNGTEMFRSVHSMLKLSNKLGYTLWITTKTVDEFQASLKWQTEELKSKPPVPSELARLAVEYLGADSFLTSYWKDFSENGISIDEFITEKSHINDILSGLQIKKTGEFRSDIEGSKELKDEESILRTSTKETRDLIIQHDAYHRIFINRVRREKKYNFHDAFAWFLTNDSKLPVYDKVARKGEHYLPFCLTIDQWIQINRPLVARTKSADEYEHAFHVLVTQPFLRTMIPLDRLDTAYNEVLGRLARYKEMNPNLASKVITDRLFILAMSEAHDEEELSEKYDSEFIKIADVYHKKSEKLQNDLELNEQRMSELEVTVNNLSDRISDQETSFTNQLEQKERDHNKQVTQLIDDLKSERKARVAAEKDKDDSYQRLRGFKVTLLKWLFFALIIIPSSIFLWYFDNWFTLDSLNSQDHITTLKVSAQVILFFAFIHIPLGKLWKTWLKVIVPFTIFMLTQITF